MKRPLTAGLSALLTCGVISAADRPSTWPEWKSSTQPGDQKIVAQIEKANFWDTCSAWGQASRKKTKARKFWATQDYLLHHNAINGIDLGGVNDRKPSAGMTKCGMYAVMGLPDDINHTEGQWGRRSQFVYRDRGVYVYTDSKPGENNGIVRSIQY